MNCPEGHVRSRAEALNSGFCKWLASVRPNEIFLRRLEGAVRRELEAERRSLSQRRTGGPCSEPAEERQRLEGPRADPMRAIIGQ